MSAIPKISKGMPLTYSDVYADFINLNNLADDEASGELWRFNLLYSCSLKLCDDMDADKAEIERYVAESVRKARIFPNIEIHPEEFVTMLSADKALKKAQSKAEEKLNALKRGAGDAAEAALEAVKEAVSERIAAEAGYEACKIPISHLSENEKNAYKRLGDASILYCEDMQNASIRLLDLAFCSSVKGLKISNVKQYYRAAGADVDPQLALESAEYAATRIDGLSSSAFMSDRSVANKFVSYHSNLTSNAPLIKRMLDDFQPGTSAGKALRKAIGAEDLAWYERIVHPNSKRDPSVQYEPHPRILAITYVYLSVSGGLPTNEWYSGMKAVSETSPALLKKLKSVFSAHLRIAGEQDAVNAVMNDEEVARLIEGGDAGALIKEREIDEAVEGSHSSLIKAIKELAKEKIDQKAVALYSSKVAL